MRALWARLIAALVVIALPAVASAQAVQQIGPVTSGHVAAWWQNGQIFDGGLVPLPNVSNTWTAKQYFGPSTLNQANINLIPGTAPQIPINGDLWATSSSLYIRLNGQTLTINANQGQASNETPSGLINGSNVTFTLAHTPSGGNIQLFYNGILLEPGSGNDFTLSGATITMGYALPTGAKLRAYYSY